jgi:hypothetical protein
VHDNTDEIIDLQLSSEGLHHLQRDKDNQIEFKTIAYTKTSARLRGARSEREGRQEMKVETRGAKSEREGRQKQKAETRGERRDEKRQN